MTEITIQLTRAQEAALREHIYHTHPAPSAGAISSTLVEILTSALDSFRDHYRTDFIDLLTFMDRLASFGKLEAILTVAKQSQQLSAYLDRARQFNGVWLGSDETQSGIGALVAMGLLTQGEADILLAYPLRSL